MQDQQSTAPEVPTEAAYVNALPAGDPSASQPANSTYHPSESQATLGPALPQEIRLTGTLIPPNALTDWGAAHRLRFFGWANGGYTGSSTGEGLLEVEPRANRFGNSWLLNQAALYWNDRSILRGGRGASVPNFIRGPMPRFCTR